MSFCQSQYQNAVLMKRTGTCLWVDRKAGGADNGKPRESVMPTDTMPRSFAIRMDMILTASTPTSMALCDSDHPERFGSRYCCRRCLVDWKE